MPLFNVFALQNNETTKENPSLQKGCVEIKSQENPLSPQLSKKAGTGKKVREMRAI